MKIAFTADDTRGVIYATLDALAKGGLITEELAESLTFEEDEQTCDKMDRAVEIMTWKMNKLFGCLEASDVDVGEALAGEAKK